MTTLKMSVTLKKNKENLETLICYKGEICTVIHK